MQGCTGLTSVQFPKETGNIYVDEKCNDALLSMQNKKMKFIINRVEFDKILFDKVRKGELSAQEVFTITNAEQRRVAYEKMDKVKMKDLPNFKTLHEVQDDGHGYPMRVVSFDMEGFDTPFRYLNVFCPSTGREYFLETKQDTCEAAKSRSFGFDAVKWNHEW
jgi:hypothetical protein